MTMSLRRRISLSRSHGDIVVSGKKEKGGKRLRGILSMPSRQRDRGLSGRGAGGAGGR